MKYKLLIDSIDEKGLVAKVSNILFNNNLNIELNNEFVDKENGKFFMRTVISGDFKKDILLDELKKSLPTKSHIKLTQEKKKDVVILATKETHCLGDILMRYYSDELNINIKAVISNYDNLQPLVEKFGIEYIHISHKDISRDKHEELIISEIEKYSPEIIVLAKYMRILTDKFVSKFDKKIINIHHSFLPAFIGANPYKQAYERGVKIIGATAHFVTNDLDEGPIISQDITRINHSYSWKDMQKAGQDVEKIVLSKALKLVIEDRVFIFNNKTVIF